MSLRAIYESVAARCVGAAVSLVGVLALGASLALASSGPPAPRLTASAAPRLVVTSPANQAVSSGNANRVYVSAASFRAGCRGRGGLCGTASNVAAVKSVTASVRRDQTGRYWNGRAYTSRSEVFRKSVLSRGKTKANWFFGLARGPDGAYTVHVRVTNKLANTTRPRRQITYRFIVETKAPPAPSITSAPVTTTAANHAVFGFADGQRALRFRCVLDGGASTPCTSQKSYSRLAAGAHTFAVQAQDQAGNRSAFASERWTIGRGSLGAPVNTVLPTISGTAQQGFTLTASTGTWTGSPTGYGYQWSRCAPTTGTCAQIPGQTSATYMAGAGDVGEMLQVAVTATDGIGLASATSRQTAIITALPANTTLPSLSGTAQQDQVLSVTPGTWTGYPAPTLTYQWEDCDTAGSTCSNVASGGTASTYTAQPVAQTIRVTVTATNAGGSTPATSAQTAIIVATPANWVLPGISGTAQQGQVLTASPGTWTGYPAPTSDYQWEDCDASGNSCSDVAASGTASTYTTQPADIDQTIRVVVTATNAQGSGVATSVQTSLVTVVAGVSTEFSAGITANSGPSGIAAGPDGNMWFTEWDGSQIGRITPAGVVTEFSAGITPGSHPNGIAAGPDGNLWFTEYTGNQIGRITPAGVVTEFSAGITAASAPNGIAAGPDGNMWFTEQSGNQIGRITPAGVVTEFSAGITPGSQPAGIAAGPDGNMWFTEQSGNRIGRITPAGMVTEFSAGITPGSQPVGIAAGPDGNMWFTEDNGNQIGRITPAGVVTEFSAGITAASSPAGIAAGPDGNLWFTEQTGNQIGRITPTGMVTEFSAGITPSSAPNGIAAGPDGNLWFTEGGDNQIGRLGP
jgi:virginiamycin B lyase